MLLGWWLWWLWARGAHTHASAGACLWLWLTSSERVRHTETAAYVEACRMQERACPCDACLCWAHVQACIIDEMLSRWFLACIEAWMQRRARPGMSMPVLATHTRMRRWEMPGMLRPCMH
eukprot:364759-Chlamydomonas_euryale.AAC.30